MYIIGSVIGGRVSFASTDDHDAMDGELVCRYVVEDFTIAIHTQMGQRSVVKLSSPDELCVRD